MLAYVVYSFVPFDFDRPYIHTIQVSHVVVIEQTPKDCVGLNCSLRFFFYSFFDRIAVPIFNPPFYRLISVFLLCLLRSNPLCTRVV